MTTSEALPADTPPVAALTDPSPEAALALVDRASERDDLVTLFGRCSLRSANIAEPLGRDTDDEAGDAAGRQVVLGSEVTLVLAATGEPILRRQWGHDDRAVEAVDDRLQIRTEGTESDDDVTVTVGSVDHVAIFGRSGHTGDPGELTAGEVPSADSSATDRSSTAVASSSVATDDTPASPPAWDAEADLRSRVLSDPDRVDPGFTPLATERETPAGPVDVYGEDADGVAVVVELKRRRVGPDAVGQLSRYVSALERDLHAERRVRGVLVAPSATARARDLLAEEGLDFAAVPPS